MSFLFSERLRPGRAILFVVAAVACIGWGLFSLVGELWPESTVPLKLGAGSAAVRRFQIAENFVVEATRNGLPMVVLPTKGFIRQEDISLESFLQNRFGKIYAQQELV